jgi:hypothetical protein
MKGLSKDFGLPNCTFRDFQDTSNEYHVMRINSEDWAQKLGFVLPQEYYRSGLYPDTPIDKLASLKTLMLDTTCSTNVPCRPKAPKEQWVYISDYAWESFMWEFFPWDGAFDDVVQAGYVPSPLTETRLFVAQCRGTASFLCSMWGVRMPALLHFYVEDEPPKAEDVDKGLNYCSPLSNLRPVTVRVVELSLKGVYTGLPANVFPTQKEQMLAITRGDKLYEQFEPWDAFDQSMVRFNEQVQDLYHRKGTFHYYLDIPDDWMNHHVTIPLGMYDHLNDLHDIVITLTILAMKDLVKPPYHFMKQIILDYLGYPSLGDITRAQQDGLYMKDVYREIFGLREPIDSEGMLADAWKRGLMGKIWPGGKVTTSSTSRVTPNTIPTASSSPLPGDMSISGLAANV